MRVSNQDHRPSWVRAWSAKLTSSTAFGVDYAAAEASRKRQAALAGVRLVDGDKHQETHQPKGERRGPNKPNGNHKQVTEQILRDRALAEQDKARALAPVRLSFEEPW